MSGIYGWNSGNSFMNSFFGTGGSGSGPSLLSSLGDLQMIKSGAYKKAMKAYYAKIRIPSAVPVRQTAR